MKRHWALFWLFGAAMAGCAGGSESHESRSGDGKKAEALLEAGEHEDKAHANEVKLAPDAIEQYGIRVEPAERRILKPTLTAPAVVSHDLERVSHLGVQLPGRIAQIQGKLGRGVKQGEPVLVIHSPQFGETQLSLFEKRVRQSASEPAIEIAKAAYERARALYDQNRSIPLAEVEKLKGEFKAAQVAAALAKADVTTASHRLKLLGLTDQAIEAMVESGQVQPLMTIHAPIDGSIIQVRVGLGQWVSPEQEPLLTIADESSFWVLADVPESMIRRLRIGSKATVHVPSLEKDFEGQVTCLASRIDPATRTLSVRVALHGAPGLRAGMFAHAEIQTDDPESSQPVLAIPEQAVQTIEGSASVFVAAEGELRTFIKRAIQIGPQAGPFVPVLSGLKEGERVVVAGSFVLKAELGKAEADHDH